MKKILLLLVVIILAFISYVATRPSDFSVTRSATMSASPEVIFAQVNDFHKWNDWSPWAKLDPNAKNSFEGPDSGEGAIFRWDGDKNVGAGNMTIVESHPFAHIGIRLEFIKPFAGLNKTDFTFKPEGPQTLVTWTMSGKNNFIAKAMGVFMDCDKMIGDMFEKGLAQMKSNVEKAPADSGV